MGHRAENCALTPHRGGGYYEFVLLDTLAAAGGGYVHKPTRMTVHYAVRAQGDLGVFFRVGDHQLNILLVMCTKPGDQRMDLLENDTLFDGSPSINKQKYYYEE